MNNLSKILVLLFAALLATGAVLYFIKMMLDPPVRITVDNGYVAIIDDAVAEYSGSRQSSYEESYRLVADRIERFHSEHKLVGKDYDRTRRDLASVYAPRLAQDCYRRLMMSWDDSDLADMENRIYRLLGQRMYAGGAPVVDCEPESAASLREIADVLKLSREACDMCSSPTFISLADSRAKMERLRGCLGNNYLKHNRTLVESARQFGDRLGGLHYDELANMVDALAAYAVMTESEFYGLYDEALAAISEYEANAGAVYGSVCPTATLRRRMERYRNWFGR